MSLNSVDNGLRVDPPEGWQDLHEPLSGHFFRLWSLSEDVRGTFGENVVESWPPASSEVPLDQLLRDSQSSCASLDLWSEVFISTWQKGLVTYGAVSGTAAVEGHKIESTSILALSSFAGEISTHQVVVTTFADNHDRHVDALSHVTLNDATLETLLDG